MVLKVQPGAGDAEIRRAYLEAIKQSPPDIHGQRFAALNRAYESIKDAKSRNLYALFNAECPGDSPLDAMVRHARLQGPPHPAPFDAWKEFLRKCAKT
jgi:curved DNA-binding protein CbpA